MSFKLCQYTYFDDLETIVNDFSHFVSAHNKITILIMIRTSAVNAMGKSTILRGSRNFLPQMYPMSFHHRFCVFDLPCLLTNSIWFMKSSAPPHRHQSPQDPIIWTFPFERVYDLFFFFFWNALYDLQSYARGEGRSDFWMKFF